MRFLLDTNILSEPLKPAPNPRVLAALKSNSGMLATAAPVWHELWFGCLRLAPSRRRSRIERYLSEVVGPSVPRVSYDDIAAEWHARERQRLTERGQTPAFVDGQIAAIAAANDLVLVTRNIGDFEAFDGVEVRDWFAAEA